MRKVLWSAGDHREHAGYCPFNFVTRDAPHVACARRLLRVRTLELQRDVARRFIQWAVILGRGTNRGIDKQEDNRRRSRDA